jgi:DNA-binding MarR family transcriptional regulator
VSSATTSGTDRATTQNLGFLLAKASQRWNELLYARFSELGHPELRPAYGSILLPLFEEDGLRLGDLARRARLAKQTMTTMVRLLERDGLVMRTPDPADGRATLVFLTDRAREAQEVAELALKNLDSRVEELLGPERAAQLASNLKEVMTL